MQLSAQSILNSLEKIWVHKDSLESPLYSRLKSLGVATEVVESSAMLMVGERLTAHDFDRSKKQLYVHPFQGQFFKRCPGSSQKRALTCCNYHILNLGSQCNMNCTYCYLQSYLNSPTLQIYSNLEKALSELENMAAEFPNSAFRIGTGEIMDSLSLDPITLYSRSLIEFFKKYPQWTLEFKTKSNLVNQFLDCEHAGNVVVSWSINCEEVIESEEHGTARLFERFAAAKLCLQRGFKVQFHLDPMIAFPGWREAYAGLIHQITQNFSPAEIGIVSLGALRFQPEQRHIMRERFGMNSKVTSGELFPSEGKKLRYDKGVRDALYRHAVSEFRKQSPDWKTYICMETPEAWINTYGSLPAQQQEIRDLFRALPSVGLT